MYVITSTIIYDKCHVYEKIKTYKCDAFLSDAWNNRF